MGDIIIVGDGVAGHSAAAEIHRLAPDQTVEVIGAERNPPYDRPPPSQIYNAGAMLHDGRTATGIDPANRFLLLSDGARLPNERPLLATGSRL